MEKKAFFYKMEFVNGKKTTVDTKAFIKDIIKKHGVKITKPSEEFFSIKLTNDERPVTLDILDYKSNYLFARIGKIKPNSDMQFREYKTLNTSDVLSSAELELKGVEIFTYFILEYYSNIIGFIYGKSAPHIMMLENLSNFSDSGYEIDIVPLAHRDTIANLSKKGSALKAISYEVVSPSNRVLGGAELDKELISEITEESSIEMLVTLKAEPYFNITENHNVIHKVLTSLKSNKKIRKLKIRAKEPNRKMRDYTLLDDYLFYNVNIDDSYTEGGVRKRFTISEYRDKIEDKLRRELIKNKSIIYELAGVEEDN